MAPLDGGTPDRDPGDPEPAAEGRTFVLAAGIAYALMIVAAWVWLWLRDRTGQIGTAAVGEHGLWVSAATGAAVGLGVSGVLVALKRYFGAFARLESELSRLIGGLGDNQMMAVALLSALGEEFFFRLAMQDALGLWPTAVLFGLLHIGPRGTRLNAVMAFGLGVAFGLMIEAGLGLLSVTLAHALVNYLSLRRMET